MKYIAIKKIEEAMLLPDGTTCYWRTTTDRVRELIHQYDQKMYSRTGEMMVVDDGGGSSLTQELLDDNGPLLIELPDDSPLF